MKLANHLLIFFITLLLASKFVTGSLGDSCVDANDLSGTCNFIHACPHIAQLKISGRKYVRCGFEQRKEVVCCAQRDLRGSTGLPPVNDKKYVRECEQYKSMMFDIDLSYTTLTAGARPTKKTASKCAQYTFPLVVGGENAYPKEFPHMALLGCKNATGKYTWTCGGSLISANYVLTAAHCFEASRCSKIHIVRLGDLDVETANDDAQPKDVNIENIIPHPQYMSALKYNDIALVKLENKVEMNHYIRPACLPYRNNNNESQLIITGWGSTQHAGQNSPHLQKAAVEQFDQEECNKIYVEEEDNTLPVGVRSGTQICAGSKQGNNDTCQGDSGGPLQTVHPEYPCMYSVVGITSYGQSCGISGVPGVYTRVYNYIDWIESVVWD